MNKEPRLNPSLQFSLDKYYSGDFLALMEAVEYIKTFDEAEIIYNMAIENNSEAVNEILFKMRFVIKDYFEALRYYGITVQSKQSNSILVGEADAILKSFEC